jgi:hypothetical protein
MGTIYDFVCSNLIRNLDFTYIMNKLAFWTSRNPGIKELATSIEFDLCKQDTSQLRKAFLSPKVSILERFYSI